MPKVKTNSGAKKRFALTGTGKIKRKHAFHSHILTKKTKKQKRNLVHVGLVDNCDVKQVRELLCMRYLFWFLSLQNLLPKSFISSNVWHTRAAIA